METTRDPFAPPPADDDTTTHRAKPKLCGHVGASPDCLREHRCILYAGHAADVEHRADRCGHRWPVNA